MLYSRFPMKLQIFGLSLSNFLIFSSSKSKTTSRVLQTMISILNLNSTSRLHLELSSIHLLNQNSQDQLGHLLQTTIQRHVTQVLDENESQSSRMSLTTAAGQVDTAKSRAHQNTGLSGYEESQSAQTYPIQAPLGGQAIQVSSIFERHSLACIPTCTCCCHSRST